MYRSNFDESWFSSEVSNKGDKLVVESYNPLDNLDNRLYNTLKLRKPTRELIKSFKAFQKVYRARYDQNFSHSSVYDLSNTQLKYLFFSEKRIKYENMLGKNISSYYDSVPYKNSISTVSNLVSPLFNSTNTYFTSIPFLLSELSDSMKNIWFGYHSRWTQIEVQPTSLARFSLLGRPKINRNFEFNPIKRDIITASENYTNRLCSARKNYISNWSTSPFLYTRLSNWYASNGLTSHLFNNYTTKNVWFSLKLSNNYWETEYNIQYLSKLTPSYTDISTLGRSSWKPSTGAASYTYNTNILGEILTKRENLYTAYFLNSGYGIYLPEYLRATPTNTLFNEVKKVYSFIDPVNFIPEVSRDFYYTDTLKTNLGAVSKLSDIASPTVINYLFKNLFYYSLNNNLHYSGKFDNFTSKNQYRSMRKGISNMVKLHATGAVAMPTEVRVHILASSKDIIHSWSIPSAGIKIDCIPGYSSHRIAIFLSSGIFFGQCMEICGRFHHWMPIVVYFLRYDHFYLWTMDFCHNQTRYYTNKIRLN